MTSLERMGLVLVILALVALVAYGLVGNNRWGGTPPRGGRALNETSEYARPVQLDAGGQ